MQQLLKKHSHALIIICLFMAMAFSLCPRYSINNDEFYTMIWGRLSWPDYVHELIHDTSPFLYYLMMWPVHKLTGGSLMGARLFSLLALLVMLIIGSSFVKKHFGLKAMYFYSFIIYLTPFMLQKSTEARMYGWATVFTLFSGVLSYYLLTAPTKKTWILFTVTSLLGAYTQYYVVLTMIFLYVGILVFYIFKRDKKQIINCLICYAVTVLTYLPWLFVAAFQINESNGSWIAAPSSKLGTLKELFYSSIPGSELFYLLLIFLMTLYAFIKFIQSKDTHYYWVCVCCSALWGIYLLCTMWGIFVKPIMLSRYLIMPVCLLFLAISSCMKDFHKIIVIILCTVIAIIGLVHYQSSLSANLNDTTKLTHGFTNQQIKAGDAVIVVNEFDDDFLCMCVEYFVPHAERIYVGEFNSELFSAYSGYDTYWFFDQGSSFDSQIISSAGKKSEEYGTFYYRHLAFDVYKITTN
ncbi:MAG: glycosyltransferase family 39 protein [Lachnospiraceae bacterium]|nr:glycosyltransferase family 39 protein [Lachnospiraceae bacterium]